MSGEVVAESSAMESAPIVGWYGKTPSAGDFVSRRLSKAIIDRLDAWLQAGMTTIREATPEAWEEHYGTSPIWDAVLPAGVLSPKVCVAVVAASFDKVGRRFPFCVVVGLPSDHAALARLTSLPEYCAGLSTIVGEAIRSRIGMEELGQELVALTLRHVRDGPSETGGRSDIAAILGDAAFGNDLATVPLNAHSTFPWPDLAATFDASGLVSYWWSHKEPRRLQYGFTHSGNLSAQLFSMLFGAQTRAAAQTRPPG